MMLVRAVKDVFWMHFAPKETVYLIQVSGGAASVLAAHICVEKHGPENCIVSFADTGSESESCYDMVRCCMFDKLRDVRHVWLKPPQDTPNIWELFIKRGFIRSPKTGCIASWWLKQQRLDRFTESVRANEKVLVTGLDWTEDDRIERFNRKKIGFKTWHPLSEWKLSQCEIRKKVDDLGYPPQDLYEKGYPHNNCGGACVQAGIAQWVGLYQDNRELFEYSSEKEQEFQRVHNTTFTILKETRDGVKRSLPLIELKKRIENGMEDLSHIRDFRSSCGCMVPNDE